MPHPSLTNADGIWKLNDVRNALIGGEFPLQYVAAIDGSTFLFAGDTYNLTTTGSVITLTLAKTATLRFSLAGAAGSTKWDIGGGKGLGGYVRGTFVNMPPGTYYAVAGVRPTGGTGGYPGGGTAQEDGSGGGGFSAVWRGGGSFTSNPLDNANRSGYLLIGGGGGGHSNDSGIGRAGDGGYPSGTAGIANYSGTIGGGGTASAGGSAAINTAGSSEGAQAGSAYTGGRSGACGNGTGTGGAGGGGWYGGGGGVAHCGNGGGAGGGGSSYYDTTLISSFTHTTASNSGNGYVTIEVLS